MEAKIYRSVIEVSDPRLQEIMDTLSERRCMKSFMLAAVQGFVDSYKGQELFELLTRKQFPFEKRKKAGRSRRGVVLESAGGRVRPVGHRVGSEGDAPPVRAASKPKQDRNKDQSVKSDGILTGLLRPASK